MPMNAISIYPLVALSQLHSIYHIVQYRCTICHISPPCRLYMMPYSWSLCPILCLEMLTVWRLWLAVFSLLPVSVPSVCIMYPVGTLHLHHAPSYHIYRSSFYLFWGQPCGCIWYAQPYSYLTLLLYAPSAPLPPVNAEGSFT